MIDQQDAILCAMEYNQELSLQLMLCNWKKNSEAVELRLAVWVEYFTQDNDLSLEHRKRLASMTLDYICKHIKRETMAPESQRKELQEDIKLMIKASALKKMLEENIIAFQNLQNVQPEVRLPPP